MVSDMSSHLLDGYPQGFDHLRMQNPSGGTIQLVPQALTVTPVSYQEGGAALLVHGHSGQATVMSAATQIEEAHSTTNHVATQQNLQDQDAALENDKRAIYRHPLFPLMALLFEKCEQATQTPDCPTSDSFDVDIQAFVHHQEQDRKPFFSDDSELDGLMLKAIQVLRIHLLELEKVNELCKDFCQRYISCLKGKLQSENLLRTDTHGLEDGSGLTSPTGLTGCNNVMLQGNVSQPAGITNLGQGQVVSGGTVYQMVQTPQGLVAQPIQIQSQGQVANAQASTSAVIHGSTPLSQIGVASPPTATQTNTVNTTPLMMSPDFDDDDKGKGKNSKRGVLPKHATQVMKSWLFQHIVHPYPTEDEKRQIAAQTNLSLLQVNNWFINARRRILQPMLDASNPEGAKTKKNKTPNRPVQRFWPENIANMQPEVAKAMAAGALSASQNSDIQMSDGASPNDVLDDSDDEDSHPDAPHAQFPLPPGVSVTADGQLVHRNPSGMANSNQMIPQLSPAQSSQSSVHNGQTPHESMNSTQLDLDNSDADHTGD